MKPKSKLDAHAAKLREWFRSKKDGGGEGITLGQARERLREFGCSVSLDTLSRWWRQEQKEQDQRTILADITSGAKFNRELESTLDANAPPELLTLIKLIKTLIAGLAVKGDLDADTLRLVQSLTGLVLEHDKSRANYELQKADLDLKERRVQLLEQKAAQLDQAKATLGDGALTEEQKQQRIRQIFGMS